jgi:hypothetical protein
VATRKNIPIEWLIERFGAATVEALVAEKTGRPLRKGLTRDNVLTTIAILRGDAVADQRTWLCVLPVLRAAIDEQSRIGATLRRYAEGVLAEMDEYADASEIAKGEAKVRTLNTPPRRVTDPATLARRRASLAKARAARAAKRAAG